MANKKATKTTKPVKKMSQLAAAVAVLRRARKPMSCAEMVDAMQAKGLWSSPGGKTPEATLYASILRDTRKGKEALFKKTAPGRFSLKK